jgi:hypothetical protein
VRGGFVVYPDDPAGGDVGIDIRKQAQALARIIAARSGLLVGGRTAMDYPASAGREGRRLRAFAATSTDGMQA